MKLLGLFGIVLFASCGNDSSPEGRLTNRIEEMQSQIDTIKKQNVAILDSFSKMNAAIKNQSAN
jgi:chaperonin cofactor prefoldin